MSESFLVMLYIQPTVNSFGCGLQMFTFALTTKSCWWILSKAPNGWWVTHQKLVPWGTDGRLPLSDLDLDLGIGHTAYRRASLIDLYLRTKFHW